MPPARRRPPNPIQAVPSPGKGSSDPQTESADPASVAGALDPQAAEAGLGAVAPTNARRRDAVSALMRASGNRAVQRLIHRAPDLGAPTQPADDKEKQAYEGVKARVGQPLVKVWFSSARKPAADQVTETFRIGDVVHRAGADTSAYAFSTQGAAQAYATTIKGSAGAVVLQQDGLYFVARLAAGDHRLQTLDPRFFKEGHGVLDVVMGGWIGVANSVNTGWFAGRDWVYRVEPKAPVVAVASMDGQLFPLNDNLEPESSVAAKQSTPLIAAPAPADDMRAMAGLAKDGGTPASGGDSAALSPEQQDSFVRSYLRSRALESLQKTEDTVGQLTTDFKPESGGKTSAKAAKLIALTRELGKDYEGLCEHEQVLVKKIEEAKTERYNAQDRAGAPAFTIDGVHHTYDEWLTELEGTQKEVLERKRAILAASPLLATMVGSEQETASAAKGAPIDPYAPSTMLKTGGEGEIRDAFSKKLDAIRAAIRWTRAEMAGGDLDFLLKMGPLCSRIEAEFKSGARNPGLLSRFQEIRAQHAAEEWTKEFLGTAIMLGALFLPGGQVISAAIGFGQAAAGMGGAMEQLTASEAAVDPTEALVDRGQAQQQAFLATAALAMAAIDLAGAVKTGLKEPPGTKLETQSGAGASGQPTTLRSAGDPIPAGTGKAAIDTEQLVLEEGYTALRADVFTKKPLSAQSARVIYNSATESGAKRAVNKRETALCVNLETGEWAVVFGEPNKVKTAGGFKSSYLKGHWRTVEHYHPGESVAMRVPSFADYDVLESEIKAAEALQREGKTLAVTDLKKEATITWYDAETKQMKTTTYGIDASRPDQKYWFRSSAPDGSPFNKQFATEREYQLFTQNLIDHPNVFFDTPPPTGR